MREAQGLFKQLHKEFPSYIEFEKYYNNSTEDLKKIKRD